jgi:formate dehydrogenase iron-sulfur subunit
MNFGDRDTMASLANKRLVEVKKKFPKATLSGIEDTRVFYLLADEPAKYHEYAQATTIPRGVDRKTALRRIARPLKELSKEWQLLHKLAS